MLPGGRLVESTAHWQAQWLTGPAGRLAVTEIAGSSWSFESCGQGQGYTSVHSSLQVCFTFAVFLSSVFTLLVTTCIASYLILFLANKPIQKYQQNAHSLCKFVLNNYCHNSVTKNYTKHTTAFRAPVSSNAEFTGAKFEVHSSNHLKHLNKHSTLQLIHILCRHPILSSYIFKRFPF